MVPDSFHEFFTACAGVSGALIGLLFVAISVHPEGVARSTSAITRTRPAAALSAFLNPLIISLLSLLPDAEIGTTITIVAAVGGATMIGSVVYLLAEGRRAGLWASARTLFSLVLQLANYVLQFVAGLQLSADPGRTSAVYLIAITMLVLFSTGIDRAWEFIGARKVNLVGSVADTILHPGSGPGHGEADHDTRAVDPSGADGSDDDPAEGASGGSRTGENESAEVQQR